MSARPAPRNEPPEWKVRPHGQLTEIDDNILTVTGELQMPAVKLQRRMTVVRLADSRLVIYSAISLDEHQMRTLEDYGRPAYLIVPNGHHRLDAAAWKARYPSIEVIAPRGAREQVDKKAHVDTTDPDFGDPDVVFLTVGGTDVQEAALLVRTRAGITLILNDIIGNLPGESGVGGWFLRKMDFAGDKPHIPKPVKAAMVGNKEELRRQLLEWAELPSLVRIVVSHGEPIEDEPREVLRELAASLT